MQGILRRLIVAVVVALLVGASVQPAEAGGFGVFGLRQAPLLFPRAQIAARSSLVAPLVVQRAFVQPVVVGSPLVAQPLFVQPQAIVVPATTVQSFSVGVQAVTSPGCGALLIR